MIQQAIEDARLGAQVTVVAPTHWECVELFNVTDKSEAASLHLSAGRQEIRYPTGGSLRFRTATSVRGSSADVMYLSRTLTPKQIVAAAPCVATSPTDNPMRFYAVEP